MKKIKHYHKAIKGWSKDIIWFYKEVIDLAEMYNHTTTYIPPRKGEARATLANIDKAKTILGYNPTINIENWLKERLR